MGLEGGMKMRMMIWKCEVERRILLLIWGMELWHELGHVDCGSEWSVGAPSPLSRFVKDCGNQHKTSHAEGVVS